MHNLNRTFRISLALLLPLMVACPAPDEATHDDGWQLVETGSTESFRGLSAVNSEVVWASGSAGTVLRTLDGGDNWDSFVVPGAEELELRDIEAFGPNKAIVLSAGSPARVFITLDGGTTWRRTHNDAREGIFYDAMAFWDRQNGIAFGDPIEGRFAVIVTHDGGATWSEPAERPQAQDGEAGFAASGSCLTVHGTHDVWFGSGGAQARVFHSTDRGASWTPYETPIAHGVASKGIFSIAFNDRMQGVIVGGDYEQPLTTTGNIAVSSDAGQNWTAPTSFPSGFRSAVQYLGTGEGALLTVGSHGSDVSMDHGATWRSLGDQGFNALDVVATAEGATAWAIGAEGVAGVSRWNRASR